MPIHDWSHVEQGILHDFHHAWIEELKRSLNGGILPEDYYALAEQFATGFGPDVLTLQARADDEVGQAHSRAPGSRTLLAPPKLKPTAEAERAYYRRKQKMVVVRHVSHDEVVAMIEVVSPGNKRSNRDFRDFVEKAAKLLDLAIHLLVLDLHKPSRRDPQGIHGAIWEEFTGETYAAQTDKPLTFVSYESDPAIRAFVVHAAVGDDLPDMPLFLEPGLTVTVPLEATYQAAYKLFPQRWKRVLEAAPAKS